MPNFIQVIDQINRPMHYCVTLHQNLTVSYQWCGHLRLITKPVSDQQIWSWS